MKHNLLYRGVFSCYSVFCKHLFVKTRIKKLMAKKGGNPNWEKGKSGNPKGRPKGTVSQLPRLLKAIENVEKIYNIDYFEIMVTRSLFESSIMNNIHRKLVPDQKVVDTNLFLDGSVDFIVTYDKKKK